MAQRQLHETGSTLAQYHNITVWSGGAAEDSIDFSEVAAGTYDASADLAVDVLSHLGYTPDSYDDLGGDTEADVQTLLTLAMFRSEKLFNFLQRAIELVPADTEED